MKGRARGTKMEETGSHWEKVWEEARERPVALVDCRQEIPCNPCEEACRRGAIRVGEDVCSPPVYDPGRCDGCGRCVALCPGMAIFLLDRRAGRGRAEVTVPWEMEKRIAEGERAWAVDERGKVLAEGKIVKVRRAGGRWPTWMVTIRVPEEWALKVRGVRFREDSLGSPEEVEEYGLPEDYPVCRCEDVTRKEMLRFLEMGFRSLTALRRSSRVGLGYCQGIYCQEHLRAELARVTRRPEEETGMFRVRPPVRPVKLGRLGGSK